MLRVLSQIRSESCFALKGGTAINFFIRDVPRLSVDIDLTYVPLDSRETALRSIGDALGRITEALKSRLPTVRIQLSYRRGEPRHIAKVFIQTPAGQIKLEPNEVLRGTLFPVEEKRLVLHAEKLFELSLTVPVLALADLYGGKICAALDRQHPRDLFDVKILLENEGLTDPIRKAFVVYLASHDRPMHELLEPARKDNRKIFESDFVGMTTASVSYDDLVQARETLIGKIQKELTAEERQFLVSIKSGAPDWNLLGIEGIERLPAIQWKLQNIGRMEKRKHGEAMKALKACLGL